MNIVKLSAAAKSIGISIETAREKVRRGDWPCFKVGPKNILIDLDEILMISRVANGHQKSIASRKGPRENKCKLEGKERKCSEPHR